MAGFFKDGPLRKLLRGQPLSRPKATSWDKEKLTIENRVCKAMEDWLSDKGIGYKSDVGFLEFPRPSLPSARFNKLMKEAEEKLKELGYSNYDIFETTMVIDFPEQIKWFEATYR